MVQVTALFRYLIKSCRGTPMQELEIGPHGPVGDRAWMVVSADASDEFVTQRQDPRLALVQPSLVSHGRTGHAVHVEAEGTGSFLLPDHFWERGEKFVTMVHKNPCFGLDQGREAAQFFSDHLRRSVRLLRMSDRDLRVPKRLPKGVQTGLKFADGYPLLLTSEGSLTALNAARPEGMPLITMDRFRPNIVVDASEAWIEETWREFSLNGIPFHGVKPCDRCSVITTHQQTAARDPRIAALLLKLHTGMREGKEVPLFGMNLIPGSIPGGSALVRQGADVRDLVVGPRPEL